MGKAAVNINSSINITESTRQRESSFSEAQPSAIIGPNPVAVPNVSGDAVASTENQSSDIHRWTVMSAGDAGLKTAIFNFINTTKDGVRVTPDTVNGREKKLVFDFYGTMGKSIAPAEIGQFEVVFKYAPTVSNPGTGPGTQTIPSQPTQS